jgi:hypothetical protein
MPIIREETSRFGIAPGLCETRQGDLHQFRLSPQMCIHGSFLRGLGGFSPMLVWIDLVNISKQPLTRTEITKQLTDFRLHDFAHRIAR